MKIRIEKEDDSGPPQKEKPRLTKEYLDSIWGNITKHGIKVMSDDSQWVLHCLTGEAFPREQCEAFRNKNGNIMWKKKGEELSIVDELKHFIWKNPEQSHF